eukprot:CAMPEP_0118915116 /NCGR_PEP_ID=MMETSP1166-20130328/15348_1 /TAXON_ID=1104430 /ORGANISM="Chrysoreinhardia sp, Strain CCMP3193" /LENGTH=385 /DNA_ID=CAMNT_0006854771 /DNA_START=52 /DNA_END=1209 /DNA_ORIENTATION=+
MVCLDTSEHMRNGDFAPTRHESQQDAANLVVGAKLQQNAENSVGVLTMATCRVLVSPTDDMGKILASLADCRVAGSLKLVEGIQVAQLALKHRRNKNGGQRLVLFVGSPVEADEKALVKAGKVLKKNNIAVDVVQLGSQDDASSRKLESLVEAASSSNDNCHFVRVPAGVVPSDVLISSPVVQPDVGSSSSGGGGLGGGLPVDASLDPELALALRVSMEEERARQQQQQQQAPAQETTTTPALDDAAGEDEDALLQRALEMSMIEAQQGASEEEAPSSDAAAAAPRQGGDQPAVDAPQHMDLDDDQDQGEDQDMQRALAMSKEEAPSADFYDPQFVNQMLSSLPGVDPNDPSIQAAIAKIRNGSEPKDQDKDKAGKKEDDKDQSK